jgi:hypothetical protein
MTSIEHLRATTEDDATRALTAPLPITDEEELAIVIGRLYAGDATQIEVSSALENGYVSLPITTPAALVEAFNCYLDFKLGETTGDE